MNFLHGCLHHGVGWGGRSDRGTGNSIGVEDGSGNYQKSGKGYGGGRSASRATQINYRQRWAASFLD